MRQSRVSLASAKVERLTGPLKPIKLVALSGETDFDVAQAFAISKLSESHGEKLIPTRERTDALVAPIACHATIEFVVRRKLDQLRKHSATLVQWSSPSPLIAKE